MGSPPPPTKPIRWKRAGSFSKTGASHLRGGRPDESLCRQIDFVDMSMSRDSAIPRWPRRETHLGFEPTVRHKADGIMIA